jgi:SEC-C motif-containing protein
MRSRYSAYAVADVDYLLCTTHPSTRKFHKPQAIKEWAQSSVWQKLEIERVADGSPKDKKGKVEFRAYYLDSEQMPQIHHEYSNFVKELGRWFFVDGKVVR